MAKARKLNLEVSLPVSVLKEGKYFVAYSPALDLSTSAKSLEAVKKRFAEVVYLFFEELTEKGTVDEVLFELGWQKVKKRWSPPAVVFQESESFKVPLPA